MSVAFFLYPFFFSYTFPRVNLLGYVCTLFKFLAFFFQSIEIFSSHYSSASTVPFLRIVRLKDCAQETTVLYPQKNVRPPSNLQRASPTRQVTMLKKRKLLSKGQPALEEKKQDTD